MPRAARRSPAPAALLLAAALSACNAGRIRDGIRDGVRAVAEKFDRLRDASPRDRYADRLRALGPDGERRARAWTAAGDQAFDAPAQAPLPLREQGVFTGDEPVALAWQVRPRRGERVTVRVDAAAADSLGLPRGARLFTELWREDAGDPGRRQLVASSDSLQASYEVADDDADAVYVLRAQPEFGARVRWRVALGAGPSLAFPVAGRDARAVESFFGAERDGGARSHEGVDIMAPRGTPAVAAEDGVVRYVGDDRLGGHVVSLGAAGGGHSLYYAHLDRWAVRGGETVRAGDTLGFVGNTGNARGGPTHLHFGVYTEAGAVDPMPYLADRRRAPSAPGRDTLLVGRPVRTGGRGVVALRAGPGAATPTVAQLAPRTVLEVDGASGGGWLRVRPAGAGDALGAAAGYVPADAVERVPGATAARAPSTTER